MRLEVWKTTATKMLDIYFKLRPDFNEHSVAKEAVKSRFKIKPLVPQLLNWRITTQIATW